MNPANDIFSETPNETFDGYLRFEKGMAPAGRKTDIILVYNKDNDSMLGTIQWYGAWRQYCFFPAAGCVFHKGCLEGINRKIQSLMDARKK